MKIALVTGAAGFSARFLIEELRKEGWFVYMTDIKYPRGFEIDPFNFMLCDLRDPNDIKDLFNKFKSIDIVFHVASVFDYSAPWDLLYEVNILGTETLCREAKAHSVEKMVLWSSCAVYGQVDKKEYNLPVTEDQKLSPKCDGLYDKSKRIQEKIALSSGLPITIIRPAPIYGAGSWYGFYTLLNYIRIGILYEVPRNMIKRHIPLIHVKDLARAAIYLSEKEKYIGEVFNIVDDNTLNMLDTVKYCANLTGGKIRVIIPMYLKPFKPFFKLIGKISTKIAKKKGTRPKLETDAMSYMFGDYYFSNKKLKKTGFKFEYPDRRFGLMEVVDWYNNNGWKNKE